MSKLATLLVAYIKQFESNNIAYNYDKEDDLLLVHMKMGPAPLNRIVICVTPTEDGCNFRFVYDDVIIPQNVSNELLIFFTALNAKIPDVTFAFDFTEGIIEIRHYWSCTLLDDSFIYEHCLHYFAYIHQVVQNYMSAVSPLMADILFNGGTAQKELQKISDIVARLPKG